MTSTPQGLSIGALSLATGIPIETLRTWERRYGFPRADRTEGGHRVYSPGLIEHLRAVQRALDAGLRAGAALRMDLHDLLTLPAMAEASASASASASPAGDADAQTSASASTDSPPPRSPGAPARAPGAPAPAQVWDAWFEAILALDGERLEQSFRQLWYVHGAMPFLSHYAGPFTTLLGERWASGELSVHHEHFASERLRDFLTSHWRPLSDRSPGPVIVCTTLPGEHHTLGLHMAAVTWAICGCKIVFLGENTPLVDIIHTCASVPKLRALAISCSVMARPSQTRHQLQTLRAALPGGVELILGGAGAPVGLEGALTLHSFESLAARGAGQPRAFKRKMGVFKRKMGGVQAQDGGVQALSCSSAELFKGKTGVFTRDERALHTTSQRGV